MPTCSILWDTCTGFQNMHTLEFDLSRSLKVKLDGVIRKSIYDFLLVNNCNYMPICSILRDIATQNMHDLEFDLSRSLKVKFKGTIRKPMYDFLLVNNYIYRLICIGSWVLSIWNFYPHKAPLYEKFQSTVKSERMIQAHSNLVRC